MHGSSILSAISEFVALDLLLCSSEVLIFRILLAPLLQTSFLCTACHPIFVLGSCGIGIFEVSFRFVVFLLS